MTVQRSPQVSIEEYYETTPFRECLDTMFREQPLKSSLAILGLLGLAFGFGFFIATIMHPATAAPQPAPPTTNPIEITQLRNELTSAHQETASQVAELKAKQENDLKALKAKYDSDLLYANDQVKKYLDMMGKSPESRKRETFLNLYLSYQTAAEIAKSNPLPMTTDERRNAVLALQKFITANLSLTRAQQEAAGFIFVIEQKGEKLELGVECGGVLRAIPTKATDGLQVELRAAYALMEK